MNKNPGSSVGNLKRPARAPARAPAGKAATDKAATDKGLQLSGRVLLPGETIGAYQYVRPIASGGMAHVVLATDEDGDEVALKVLKANRMGTGLQRFRREFRALARLRHPNIIRVDTYGDIDGHPYIAMEYAEGRDLHQEIRTFNGLEKTDRWRRVEKILADLSRALFYIHRRGLVHRDLKPSNVLIDKKGTCKLTDFGIVKDLNPANDPFVSTTLVGTWAYASPEQITGQPIDHRSDLYSLGVILFAMLTSKRPFAAKDMAGYITLHRDRSPMLPRTIDPEVPVHLEEICLRLLSKAPHDRFQSGAEIIKRLEASETHVEVTAPITEESEWRPPLVGRDFQLRQIEGVVSALTRGSGGVLLIEGVEGSGRSRMFEAVLENARRIGIPAYSAQMSPTKGAFEPLLQIAEAVGLELGARVPRDLNTAIRAFARGSGQIAGDLRYQLYDGIRGAMELLLRDGPLVIAMDDLHLAPAPLVGLLSYLVRTLIVRDHLGLLLVGTLRDDVVARPLSSFRDGSELGLSPIKVHLSPLEAAEVRLLVESMIGVGPRAVALAARLHRETRGNPFFVAEFMRGMNDEASGHAGAAEPGAMGERNDGATEIFEIPPGIRQVVMTRFASLSQDERLLVETMSAAGREIDLDVLLDVLSDQEEESVLDHIDHLVELGLLVERRVAMQTLIGFAHPKVGEVVYSELDEAPRIDKHRKLGAALEVRHAANPLAAEVIGEHYRRAGKDGRAYLYLVKAAMCMWERSLLGEAWRLGQRAEELEEEARVSLSQREFLLSRITLLRVQSDAQFNRGAWGAARESLTALRGAALTAGDERLAAEVGLKLGRTLDCLGHQRDGTSLVTAVLEKARQRRDRESMMGALHVLASFAFERGDLDTCELLASQGLASAKGPALLASRAKLLLALTVVQASRGQMQEAVAGLTEAEKILRKLRKKREIALVLCNLAEIYLWQGDLASTISRSTAGLSLARDVLYGVGDAWAHRVRGIARLQAGDRQGARQDLNYALSRVGEVAEQQERVAIHYALGGLELVNDSLGDATRYLEEARSLAQRNDPERYMPAIEAKLAWVLALQGETTRSRQLLRSLSSATEALALPRRTEVQLSMGAAWLVLGTMEEARPLLRTVAKVSIERGFRWLAIMASLKLARITPADEAQTARAEAARLAKSILSTLPQGLAAQYRADPMLSSLWTSA